MYIPMKYKEDPNVTPETGSVEVVCKICGQKFWVPADDIPKIGAVPICENEACVEAYEKAQAEIAALELKKQNASTSTTSDPIASKAAQI